MAEVTREMIYALALELDAEMMRLGQKTGETLQEARAVRARMARLAADTSWIAGLAAMQDRRLARIEEALNIRGARLV